eukprot:COSAG04_NODE_23931_length_330_cov_0.567100_1_plen_34_part_01
MLQHCRTSVAAAPSNTGSSTTVSVFDDIGIIAFT